MQLQKVPVDWLGNVAFADYCCNMHIKQWQHARAVQRVVEKVI